ncbi:MULTISPECIES: DUF2306 domain-containing protein [unclassified Nocardiopsis]|uniref:DUF2306 domain-containing protein n=1 Tax=Nocardiopsis TaxID=2013 RepID=UPI00387B8B3B
MPPSSPVSPAPVRRRHTTGLIIVTVLCVLVTMIALPAYLGLDPAEAQIGLRESGLHYPALVLHVGTSVLALLTAPLQLWPALRRRGAHRVIGRIHLFAGVFPGAVSGMVLAVLSTAGPVAQTGFGLLSVLWFTTAAAGWRAIRQGRVADHREWMVRVFSLTMAGVMLRVLVPLATAVLPLMLGPGVDEEAAFALAYPAIAWLCWVPNLLVAELVLRRRPRPAAVAAAAR